MILKLIEEPEVHQVAEGVSPDILSRDLELIRDSHLIFKGLHLRLSHIKHFRDRE